MATKEERPELEELAIRLANAKNAENEAKKIRIKLEEEIAAAIETAENGSRTVQAGRLSVTVKRGISYKADISGLIDSGIGDVLVDVPATVEFDEKAYERLRNDNPAKFAEAAKFVTTVPKKVAVTLKF